MTRMVLALLAALVLASPVSAVEMGDPRAVVAAVYAPYMAGDDFDWSNFDDAALRSASLNALYQHDMEEADGEMGRLDFDPFIDAQDYDITSLDVGPVMYEGGRALVDVSFVNFTLPKTLRIVLVKEGGEYRIDDVVSLDPDYPYSLRAILEAPLMQ